MSHLSAERLAALADAGERPTPIEAAHLAACTACEGEHVAYDALVAGARAERGAIGTPLTTWEGIAAGLRADEASGLGHRASGAPIRATVMDLPARRRLVSRVTRIAAGIVLLVGGAFIGRASAVAGPLAVVSSSADGLASGARRLTPDVVPGDDLVPDYASVSEAQTALARYSVAYQHAAAFLAEHDTTTWLHAPDDYRTRLIALERAGRTMREAMEEAPYDPVLTGYYLTTLGQREATLRQLNVALPAGERLNSF